MSIGMDAFRVAAEMRHTQLNAVETTHKVNICKVKQLPKKKLSLGQPKHMETGICIMLHTVEDNTVLEVRGYDEDANEFSYKFFYERSPKQPVNIRAVGASGMVNKLKVCLDDNPSDKHMKIHQGGKK